MARNFHCGFKIAVYARTVYVRRVVEREGVSKCLTVRYLMSPGGCRKAAVHAATFSHFRHFEPSSGWVGHRRGVETALCLAARGGCRLKAAFPDRVRRLRPAWLVRRGKSGAWAGLASAGRSADAPACGQAVGSKLARTDLDLGRPRWMRGNAQWMYGKAKGLNESNTLFICDRDERGSGSRACFKISRRPATRDFGRDLGGEFRASPQRAVRNEPTPATGKGSAARRVFGQKAVWLRSSSVTDRWRVCSLVAPRHPAFCPTTGPLRILKQALQKRNGAER